MARACHVLAALVAAAAFALAGCGDEGPRDDRVGDRVEGSGEVRLLADPTFRRAVAGIGVSPRVRPASRLGRSIGRQMHVLMIDTGRLAPRSFTPGAYRRMLERRGRLTATQFRRRHGQSPQEMCDRLGALTGQLDWRLDEGAGSDLARSVEAGFGRGRPAARPANRIAAVRDELNGKLPGEDAADCVTRYRSSYVFVASLYRDG